VNATGTARRAAPTMTWHQIARAKLNRQRLEGVVEDLPRGIDDRNDPMQIPADALYSRLPPVLGHGRRIPSGEGD